MTSNRPYLIRAFYEWISDNDFTPYLLVNATYEKVVIPTAFIDDGKIILNVAARAVRALDLSNEAVSFEARFGGRAMNVYVPIQSVLAIYAQENGQGMFFGDESPEPDDPSPDGPPGDDGPADKPRNEAADKPDKPARPSLRVVK